MLIVQALSGLSPTLAGAANPLENIWSKPPLWIAASVAFLIAAAGLITVLKPLASALAPVARLAVRPFRGPDAEEAYRIQQRGLFAGHIERQLDHLAGKEDWHDERFAELEAEVETEGRERVAPWLRRFSPTRVVALRREKSLSKALTRSEELLVILEGEPGAGKSVALRHLAQRLARQAREVRKPKTATFLVPLYVNLKDFKPAHRPADASAVRQFILDSLNRIDDRDVEAFLDREFDRGLQEGTWLLLLDSFDEIPAVLSSTESDSAVEEFALAIRDFLSGMKQCRAVIASREFRGPKAMFRVPRFRVMPLSPRQQQDLIHRSGLHPAREETVYLGLAGADPDMRQLARNPMYLSLVCDYVKRDDEFPQNCSTAYDSYLAQRLARDEARIQRRYAVPTTLVRGVAERAAYCMASVTGLGLIPTRRELRAAVGASFACSDDEFDRALDALEFIKIGRSQHDLSEGTERRFTFAHRRFQEYFATQVVLQEPGLVPPRDLLTNGRWRETAVTILQTQPAEVIAPLLEQADLILAPMAAGADQTAVGPLFSWPEGCLHLLRLLDAGLGRAPDAIPAGTRAAIGTLLRTGRERGRRHDRRTAVSLALCADRETTIWLLEEAFASGSVLLGGEAYQCVGRLADPPPTLYRGVRRALLDMAASGQLREERLALRAQMSRLPEPRPLLRVLRMLGAAQYLDLALVTVILASSAFILPFELYYAIPFAVIGIRALRPMMAFPRNSPRGILDLYVDNVPLSIVAGVFARALILFTTILFLTSPSPSYPHLNATEKDIYICCIVVSFYFLLWCFVVPNVCVTGSPASVPGWTYAPAVVIFRGVRTLALQRYRKVTLACSAGIFCIITLCVIYHADIAKFFDSPITDIVMLAFCGISLVVGAVAALMMVRESSQDFKEIRNRAAVDDTSPSALLDLIGHMRSRQGYDRALDVMSKVSLTRSPENMRAIADIAFSIERGQGNWELRYSPVPGLSAEVAEWLVSRQGHGDDDLLFSVSDPVLDRVARAVEEADVLRQLELASQGDGSAG